MPASKKRFSNILILAKNVLVAILALIFLIVRKINIKKNSFSTTSGKLRIMIPAILIIVIALIASYFLLLKATIAITIDPKISQQNKSVLFSTVDKTDPSKNTIKGSFATVSEDGSVSTAATGKKDIGTNAKGTVTIFNLSDRSISLPKDTEIASPNGLKFTLDNSVTIASASSTIDSNFNKTTKSSTANINITADQLGKESNLPSGTKFNVKSFDTSDLIAKNDNPFSGGTKKEVTVVSKNDSSKLEGDLVKQLENKAKEDLQGKLNKDKILLPKFITETLGKKSLNAKIGDEASQVTLTGTVDFQGLSYNKDDFIKFSKSFLSKDVPINQEIDYNNIKTDVLEMKNKNDEEIEANLNIKTLLLPKIDENKLTKDLKGKSFKTAEDSIYKLPQVANVNIKLSPNIPFLPKNLPAREKNIIIKILKNG